MDDETLQALLDCALHEHLVPMRWPSEADRAHGAGVADDVHAVGFGVGQRRPPGGGGLIFPCGSHPPLPAT